MEGLSQECRRYGKGFHSSFRQYLEQWGLFPIRIYFFSETMQKEYFLSDIEKKQISESFTGFVLLLLLLFLNYLTRSVMPQKFKLRWACLKTVENSFWNILTLFLGISPKASAFLLNWGFTKMKRNSLSLIPIGKAFVFELYF